MATGVLIAALLIFYRFAGLNEGGLHGTVVVVAILAALCVAAVSTTSGISGERESRTWEALLTTPLSAGQIVLGKFFGALRRQWFIPALLSVHVAIATIYWLRKHQGMDPAPIPFLAAIFAAPIIGLSGTGVLFSLLCRKSTVAAVCNFGLALLVWVVILFVVAISTSFLGRSDAERDFLSLILCANPVAMCAWPVLGRALSHNSTSYDLFEWGNVSADTFGLVVAAYCVLYLGAAALSLKLAASILAIRTMRRA
jgi:ABC-type transport system involved in multi-copper enzyme maturation permease subunit